MADIAVERGRAIDLAVSQIEKQFGKGSIMRLGSKDALVPMAVIPTGAISFDAALGVGGYASRHGWSRSSVLSRPARLLSHCMSLPRRRRAAGWPPSSMPSMRWIRPTPRSWAWTSTTCWFRSPTIGEQALEIAESLVRSGAVDVLVVDSVAALVPKAELDGEMGDSHVGLQARLMSQALRKLTGIVAKSTYLPHLHQPDSREDRRHVRQSGNHDGRPRAEVLLLRARRHSPHRHHQGRRRWWATAPR